MEILVGGISGEYGFEERWGIGASLSKATVGGGYAFAVQGWGDRGGLAERFDALRLAQTDFGADALNFAWGARPANSMFRVADAQVSGRAMRCATA